MIYHLPFTKQGLKANRLAIEDQDDVTKERLSETFEASKQLSMRVGNIYTASLYMSLLSLLENYDLEPNSLIGLLSYGSGAMAEFFSGNVVDGYKEWINPKGDAALLDDRQRLTVEEYEKVFNQALEPVANNQEFTSDEHQGVWYFAGVKNDIRQYRQD